MPKGRKPGSTYTKKNANILANIIARFKKKYIIDVNTGCWNWSGKSNFGYGTFYMKGKIYPAHRASYILFVKDVPSELMVCHGCNNSMCVNPEHLYAGTHQDNMKDLRKAGTLSGKNNPSYGVKCSPEKRDKISMGVKNWIEVNSQFYPSIYTYKNWLVKNPNGVVFKIKNLSKFCRENNLHLSNNKTGFYIVDSGWVIERKTNESN